MPKKNIHRVHINDVPLSPALSPTLGKVSKDIIFEDKSDAKSMVSAGESHLEE